MSFSTERVIRPANRFPRIDWPELWRYRDLFIVLTWRDIAIRYKQTALGVLWAILQPFVNMVVFTFIFNRLAGIKSESNIPYPLFLYTGLLLWQYYSGVLANASNSMVLNANIIQKIYFPRLIIPTATAITGLIDMSIGAVIMAGMMIYYRILPHLNGVLLLPVLIIIVFLSSLGVGFFFAAINVKYRDVRYALPFVIQVLMYVTPVIYPIKMLDHYPVVKTLMLWLNPISGAIVTARSTLWGDGIVDWHVLAISLLMSVVFFFCGLYYFRSTERYFADIA